MQYLFFVFSATQIIHVEAQGERERERGTEGGREAS